MILNISKQFGNRIFGSLFSSVYEFSSPNLLGIIDLRFVREQEIVNYLECSRRMIDWHQVSCTLQDQISVIHELNYQSKESVSSFRLLLWAVKENEEWRDGFFIQSALFMRLCKLPEQWARPLLYCCFAFGNWLECLQNRPGTAKLSESLWLPGVQNY